MRRVIVVLFAVVSLCFAQNTKKTAVAVMDLRGSGISESDARFLTDRLVIELQQTDVFDVMERDKMNEILKEQGFQQTGACDQTSCLVEAGRLLPVDKMIGGSVGKIGETYSIQIRLIDLKTAKVEKTAVKDFSEKIDYLLTDGVKTVVFMLGNNPTKSTNGNDRKNDIVQDSCFAYVISVRSANIDDEMLFKQADYDRQKYEWLKSTNSKYATINKGTHSGVKKDDRYKIYRITEKAPLVDPITKEVLKKETKIDNIASLQVIKVNEKTSDCMVINQRGSILIGDKVYKVK